MRTNRAHRARPGARLLTVLASAAIAVGSLAQAPAPLRAALPNYLSVDQSPTIGSPVAPIAIATTDPMVETVAAREAPDSVYLEFGDPSDAGRWWIWIKAPAGETVQPGTYADMAPLYGISDKTQLGIGRVDWGELCSSWTSTLDLQELTWSAGLPATFSADVTCGGPSPLTLQLRYQSSVPVAPAASTTGSIDLPRTLAGTDAPIQPVVVANIGSTPLHPGTAVLEGADAADFHITSDGCDGATVAPVATCTVTVRFSPLDGPSIERYAQLRVPLDSFAGSRTVPLHGPVTRPTATTVSSDNNPDTSGQGATITAVTTPTPWRSSYHWYVDGQLENGLFGSTLVVSQLGQHTVQAVFDGIDGYASSSSNTITQTNYSSSWITWSVWPSFNQPAGVMDIEVGAWAQGSAWLPGGTLTLLDLTTSKVLATKTFQGNGEWSIDLPRTNLSGLHYLKATYTGVQPYLLPSESTILVEGTPATDNPGVLGFEVGGLATLATPDEPGSITVRAVDAHGAIAAGYTGTVHLASSDPAAELPADYTFTKDDKGSHDFPITLHTTGDQTITVTDVATGAVTATQHVVVAVPATAAALAPVAVTLGPQHACGLGNDGVVRCWGSGQLIGTAAAQTTDLPTAVAWDGLATSVAAGTAHTCAVRAGGTVWCWGDNGSQQAPGDGSPNGLTPHPVPGLTGAVAVSAGERASCALLASGKVDCWGAVAGGSGTSPTAVAGISGATAIAEGAYHACAILSDGIVDCWGYNGGSFGDGTTTEGTGLAQASGIATAVAIGAGGDSTCAVLANHTIRCWGKNDRGQLGDGTTIDRPYPVAVAGITHAVSVAMSATHACAILLDTSVVCWGGNDQGQLGDGTTIDRLAPVSPGFTGATALGLAADASCAVAGDGLRCWGANDGVRLANGSWRRFAPVAPTGLGNVIALADHGPCALEANHTVRCWGPNWAGQLGNGTTKDSPVPVAVSGLAGVTQVSFNGFTACAVLDDATVDCWGWWMSGLPGTAYTSLTTPVAVPGLSGIMKVSVGSDHACALATDKSVWCWGANAKGQLGSTDPSGSLVHVPGLVAEDVVAIDSASCALLADGTIDCWGDGEMGQLGNAYTTSGPTPSPVTGISTATAISGGHWDMCAVLASGDVQCWGYNESGQIGDGTQSWATVPKTVVGVSGATAVSQSGFNGCARLGNGSVKCWGSNTAGGLGDGTTLERHTAVTAIGVVAETLSTSFSTTGYVADGTARLFGSDGDGQIGDGTTPYAARPVAVQWPTSPPRRVTIDIPAATNTLNVPIVLTATAGGAPVDRWYVGEQPPSLSALSDAPTSKPTTITLLWGDSVRTVYAGALDARGQLVMADTVRITIDTKAPDPIASLPAATRSTTVPLTLSARDSGSGVRWWLVSTVADPPRADDPRWSLTKPTTALLQGGIGVRHVYAWVMDGAHNISVPAAPTTFLDTLRPTGGTAPIATLRTSSSMPVTSGVPIRLAWGAATDNGPGHVTYQVRYERSGVSGTTAVTLASATAQTVDLALPAGTYRFRVRAVDAAGNTGAWRIASGWTRLSTIDDGSGSLVYGGTFSRVAVAGALGGWVRDASSAHRSVTVRAAVRGIALVSTRGPSRGRAQVWVDGVLAATVDLYAASTQPARVVWARSWTDTITHTVRVVVLGAKSPASSSRRVDIDGFVLLR